MDCPRLETKLMWATVRAIEPSSRHSTLYPDGIPAWLIQRGQVRLRFEDEVTEAKAGEWVLPKRGTARYDFTDDAVTLSVRFQLRWPSGEDLFERTRTLILPDRTNGELRRAANAMAAYFRGQRPSLIITPASPPEFFALQSAYYRWLEYYTRVAASAGLRMRAAGDTDGRLLRARQLLDGWELSKPISRSEFAAQIGWSLAQMTRRFVAEYGNTPRAYFNQRRFSWVRSELAHGERTIKEIAAAAGYASLAQFSNWFTRRAGISPRNYRQRVRLGTLGTV